MTLKSTFTILMVFLCLAAYAQDSLVLKTGERIGIKKVQYTPQEIVLKSLPDGEVHAYPWQEVLAKISSKHDNDFFIKPYPNSKSGLDYQMLERIESGPLNLYIKKSSKGQIEKTLDNFHLYLEKGDRIEQVYVSNAGGKRKKDLFNKFKSFMYDDADAIFYVDGPTFKQRLEEIRTAVQKYNLANHEDTTPQSNDVVGNVILYRTNLQKSKEGLRIFLQGERHFLYIDDFISLRVPINRPVKLRIKDSKHESERILTAAFNDLYYEVSFDDYSGKFVFEKKEGEELQYEFYKIKSATKDKLTKEK